MADTLLARQLWHEAEKGQEIFAQEDLFGRDENLIILGEPGMGKTELLRWLGNKDGWVYCSARQLKNAGQNARRLLGNVTTLVVDALDELSVHGVGEAVDTVLGRLGDMGCPRFVLACRASDWRNATAIPAIREQYGKVGLLVLHLKPFAESDIRRLLQAALGGDCSKADAVIAHFTAAKLDGLLGNPQTLELAARVARTNNLPDTKGQLFERAVEILRKEHRDTKADLQPDEVASLDAAGAAFAALIFTGSDALVVETADVAEDELALNEVAALPAARDLKSVLGSRLFATARTAHRFSYWHRRIGEYLGSRWLVRQATTALQRKRLLALFRVHGVVPASLRGMHAWLAHHDSALAPAVIAADPMGLIEYGDADVLDAGSARLLLKALHAVAIEDPHFRSWQRYSVKSLLQPALTAEVHSIITDPASDDGLTLLLIEAMSGVPLDEVLRADLARILIDPSKNFALRSRAVEALAPHEGLDWKLVGSTLRAECTIDSLRLALEITQVIGVKTVGEPIVVGLIISLARKEMSMVGLLYGLADAIPEERLGPFLDELSSQIASLGNRHERPNNDELTTLGIDLIARRLASGPVEAAKLWQWLRPFDARNSFSRETQDEMDTFIRGNKKLRRATQQLVLLDEPGPKSLDDRAWSLTRRSSGFTLTSGDVVTLLRRLDAGEHDDARRRDLLRLIQHSATEGVEVREVAKSLVGGRPGISDWIDDLAVLRISEWKIKEDARVREQEEKRITRWQAHRAEFAPHIDAMRQGDVGFLINPAKTYLGQCYDMDNKLAPHDRVAKWLGADLGAAGLEGFEAFLCSAQPPTAFDVAESYAQSRMWHAAAIIVAALAERMRNAVGFDDVSDDRLTVAFYELRRGLLNEASSKSLNAAIDAEMRSRGLVGDALQVWIEHQMLRGRNYIDQLRNLLRNDVSVSFAIDCAADWLTRFTDLGFETEADLIDRLIVARRFDTLRELLPGRLAAVLSKERRRNWDTVALLVDFEAYRADLARTARDDFEWLYTIRDRYGPTLDQAAGPFLSVKQLVWIFETFRSAITGRLDAEGAHRFLRALGSRLAAVTNDEATSALQALHESPADDFTRYLGSLRVEQRRKRAEELYRPPRLAEVRTIVEAQPPLTISDLHAMLLELLDQVQRRIVADPADPWRGFYADDGGPYNEERCRDHLLTMLGPRPEAIELIPEGHLADDNRADIIAIRGGMRIPIEVKGQWHQDLWRAADTQLDRLYATDFAARGRGIYLVFWFGLGVSSSKLPKAEEKGRQRPQSACELQRSLTAASRAAQDGRVSVVVLDVSRLAAK